MQLSSSFWAVAEINFDKMFLKINIGFLQCYFNLGHCRQSFRPGMKGLTKPRLDYCEWIAGRGQPARYMYPEGRRAMWRSQSCKPDLLFHHGKAGLKRAGFL